MESIQKDRHTSVQPVQTSDKSWIFKPHSLQTVSVIV